MKAVRYTAPHELTLAEVDAPRPMPGQVLIDVAALGICGSDLLLWEGGFSRVTPPVTVGHEFSGVIADANGAPGLADGDRVVVEPLLNCGECAPCRRGDYNVCARLRLVGIDVDGAAARQVVVPARAVHRIPDGLDLRDAALAEPLAVALHMTARSGITADDEAFVVGGGPIGALVACVLRVRGVRRIVVSEPNGARRNLLDSLGFETFDPITGEIDALIASAASDGFDVSFELTGVPVALGTAAQATRIQGTILLGGIPHSDPPFPGALAVLKELTLHGARTYRSENVEEAIRLLAEGAIPARALVTSAVPLEHAVDAAFEVLKSSRDEMKILVTIGDPDPAFDDTLSVS
jgi:2-desacetyl-2-hydroxyethyl bacteriochlorophyllide A dehydrogenase